MNIELLFDDLALLIDRLKTVQNRFAKTTKSMSIFNLVKKF